MQAVITGDIINSQHTSAKLWNTALKKALMTIGESPYDWEIYRGDSFQLVTSASAALQHALIIKAVMRSLANVNVRMGIGVGAIEHRSQNVTESTGEAFIASGHQFDQLKRQTLAIETPWKALNEVMEMAIPLAMLTADNWTVKTAEVILLKWWNPDWSQQQIAEHLQKKAQGNISEAFKRGGFDELEQLIKYYQQQINQYVTIRS